MCRVRLTCLEQACCFCWACVVGWTRTSLCRPCVSPSAATTTRCTRTSDAPWGTGTRWPPRSCSRCTWPPRKSWTRCSLRDVFLLAEAPLRPRERQGLRWCASRLTSVQRALPALPSTRGIFGAACVSAAQLGARGANARAVVPMDPGLNPHPCPLRSG